MLENSLNAQVDHHPVKRNAKLWPPIVWIKCGFIRFTISISVVFVQAKTHSLNYMLTSFFKITFFLFPRHLWGRGTFYTLSHMYKYWGAVKKSSGLMTTLKNICNFVHRQKIRLSWSWSGHRNPIEWIKCSKNDRDKLLR